MKPTSSNFGALVGKLSIGSLDKPDAQHSITAHYNPSELELQKQAKWSAHGYMGGEVDLEYTGAEPRTLQLQLTFDGYETQKSVEPEVIKLERLASPIKPGSDKDAERRPHHCVVTWGERQRRFVCVIEQVTTKYIMFARDGMPVRATCTVKLKEANRLSGEKRAVW